MWGQNMRKAAFAAAVALLLVGGGATAVAQNAPRNLNETAMLET
jgi:hypothetical protein